MILAIVIAYIAYKRADAGGRNGILWAFVGVIVFIGTQLMVSIAAGTAIGVMNSASGDDDRSFDDYSLPIQILAIALGVAVSWLLLRYLDRPPADAQSSRLPPPPPSFTGGTEL